MTQIAKTTYLKFDSPWQAGVYYLWIEKIVLNDQAGHLI